MKASDPKFDQVFKESLAEYLEMAEGAYSRRVDMILWECQSPIERLLACHLARLELYGDKVHILARALAPQKFREKCFSDGLLCLEMQAQVGKYRVDFLIHMQDCDGEPQRIVVECDGHDYHERTKEQAAHDRARDREMTAAGYHVFRFTGSEIHRNAVKCFNEVDALMDDLYFRRVRKMAANG